MLKVNRKKMEKKEPKMCEGMIVKDTSDKKEIEKKLAAGHEVELAITPVSGYDVDVITVKDAHNNEVTVTGNKFTMPASNVTVTVTFKAIDPERIPLDWIKGYRKAIAAIYEQGRDKYGLRLLSDVGIALTTPCGEVTLEPSKKKVGRLVLELNGLNNEQRAALEQQGIAHEWFLQTRDHRTPKGVYRVTAFGVWVESNIHVPEEETLRKTVENTFKVFDCLLGK